MSDLGWQARVDLAGHQVKAPLFPGKPAGFALHSAVQAVRHDTRCVLPVHSINGMAVSAQRSAALCRVADLAWPGLRRRLDRQLLGHDR